MMRSDTLNWHDYGVYTEMNALSLNIYYTDEDESKRITVHEILPQNCFVNEDKSKQSIVNETLSQNYYADVDKLCSTEIDISEHTITEQKDADYEEYSVTKEVPSYFNIFECGRNLLDRLDVTYEGACMAAQKDKYYTKLFQTLVDVNIRNGATFSNEKNQQAVIIVMEETEAEIERNINKITMDTSFQSPVRKKDVSTINDYIYNESKNQVDTISNSK